MSLAGLQVIFVEGPRGLVGGLLGRVALRRTPGSFWGGGIMGTLLTGSGLALAWLAVSCVSGAFFLSVSSAKRRRG